MPVLRLLCCLSLVLLATQASAAEPLLDGCHAAETWAFSPGAEFPGATGGIAAVDEGLALSWDFSAGGAYVAATWRGKPPADLTGFALAVTSDAPCTAAIRLRDAHGRTFQSPFITVAKGASSLPRAVAGPWNSAWGGTTTGDTPAAPVAITILVDKRNGTPAHGRLVLTGLSAIPPTAPTAK